MENGSNFQSQSSSLDYRSEQIPGKGKMLKIISLILGFIVLGLVIGYFIFQGLNNNKNIEKNVLLATVGDKKIYTNDVKLIAAEQFSEDSIDDKVIKTFKNIAIERAILDIEADKLGINITKEQIESRKKETTASSSDNDLEYKIIKDKIMQSQVKSVSAITIGFWIASFDYPQKPEYAIQRSQGKLALTAIEEKMKQNETPSSIAEYVMNTYPEIKEKVAVNGYIYSQPNDPNLINNPRDYTLNPEDLGKSYNDDELQNAMSKMKSGDIVKVERSDGSGGNVVQAFSVSSGSFASYADFLKTRKSELVKLE